MSDQRASPDPHTPGDEPGWHVRSGLSMREMEQLLDWLEQCGCTCREVYVDVLGATVRWRSRLTARTGPEPGTPSAPA